MLVEEVAAPVDLLLVEISHEVQMNSLHIGDPMSTQGTGALTKDLALARFAAA